MTDTSEKPLNILVCTKFVIDPSQLQAEPSSGRPDLRRAPFRINTFDENAIEAALRLKAQHGGRVVAVSLVAAVPPKDVMLKALAMGVDALYLVKDEAGIVRDAYRVAAVLAGAARTVQAREALSGWDLIICGEASVDEYNGQVGPRMAAALDLPAVTYATDLAVTGDALHAERTVEERAETVEVQLPALATVGMEINDPRMPTVLQIMGAGRKPIVELALAEIDGLDGAWLQAESGIESLEVFAPPSARKQILVGGESTEEKIRELLRRLGADGEVKF